MPKKTNEDATKALVQRLMERIGKTVRSTRYGRVTYVIGNNGTGKSRILAELAKRLGEEHPRRAVACIANSVHDRFTFGDHGRVRYLGARNAPNAVFQSAVDRQLCRFVLQAMNADHRHFTRLSEATNMELTFSIGLESLEKIERLDEHVPSESRATERIRKRAERHDLLGGRSLGLLRRIKGGDGRFSSLTQPQIRVLLQYLDLNIDITVRVGLPDGSAIPFGALSTGEQNRMLLLAKMVSAMEEGAVFLIDEPEISLHLHWQMELHQTIVKLMAGLSRFHLVIATHAPIIISEAARMDTDRQNMVAVLRRVSEDGKRLQDLGPGVGKMAFDMHTFDEVASHEQLVLRHFQTAPYAAREISVEIADTVLNVADGVAKDVEAVSLLRDLRSAKGLPTKAVEQIDAAISLIERDLVTSIRGSATR